MYVHVSVSTEKCTSVRVMLGLFSSISRWYWDILVVVLLMFTVIVLPVSIAFYSEDQTKPQWLTVNTLVDILFITDIVTNFRTGIASTDNPDIVSQSVVFSIKHLTLCKFDDISGDFRH